jgi:hypothetical protein
MRRFSFMHCLLPLCCPGKLSQHPSDWAASITAVLAVQDRRLLSLSGSKPYSPSTNSWPNTSANRVICSSLFVRVQAIPAV